MKVKEVYVSRDNPKEMLYIIEEELMKNKDIQVFIDSKIFQDMRRDGHNYSVYTPNIMKTHHYAHDNDNFGGEDWLSLTEGTAFDKTIINASFISNCNDYMQLVQLNSKKVSKYTHFCQGFTKLLLIHYENDS